MCALLLYSYCTMYIVSGGVFLSKQGNLLCTFLMYSHLLKFNLSLGRFVVVCGDGEYIIYTAMALRNKSFGSAQEFVWASDSSEYVHALCDYCMLQLNCRKGVR